MITFAPFSQQNFADSLIVTDGNLQRLYGIVGDNVYLLPDGEQAKCFAVAEGLCRWFLQKGLSRDGKVVAVGGGSVGDTVGFAASVYKRGVRLTHVPTTLLAMVDSSVGGKTAIDLDGVKNAVGTFYRADTLVDVNFLNTLDRVQLASGMGEVLKYRMLSARIDGATDLVETIRLCVDYKERLCEEDFFDRGARHVLNAGHTVGHAIELAYNLPHGVAVANGLYYELQLARRLDLCTLAYMNKWQGEIMRHFDVCNVTLSALETIKQDKKNTADGNIVFALPTDSGAKQVSLPFDYVVETLCK